MKMKLFIVLVACLLLVRGEDAKSDEVKPQAEKDDIEGVLDEISKTDNQEKKDFLLGLAAHAIHGTLGAAHGALNLVGHALIGDEKTTNLDDIFAAISKTDNQEKKDFFLRFLHHAVRGILKVGHHGLNLVGHIAGDNKDVSLEDIEGVLDEISKTDNQEKKDFFLGLLHHAVRGVLSVGHHALNLVGHIAGDNKDVSLEDIEGVLDEISKTDNQEKKDFLLGLAHHYVRGAVGVLHHNVNFVGHVVGDDKYETSEEIPTPQFDNYRTTERVY